MDPHQISVILPVYNCERYLAEAMESVLGQTYRSFEIFVIDDGSTDGSGQIAKNINHSQLRYFYQRNKGLSAALNTGIQLARGKFFAFLDADDIWTENKLDLQMKAFLHHSELDMVFGHISQFISPDVNTDLKAGNTFQGKVLPGFSTGTLLIKRDSFFRVGLFDTTWRVGQFVDWYSKAQEVGLKFTLLPDVVMERRIHSSNMGLQERGSKADYLRILKSALDRKRKKDPHTKS